MDPTPLQTIALWANGALDGADCRVERVCTDTRAIQPGDLFVALKGENFDGHAFVDQAARAGAAAAVVERGWKPSAALPEGFTLIRVSDGLAALQAIAREYRATLPMRVIGITGSSGKTSTKDFTAAVLSRKYRVLKTEGNFNNHIGLPLTLLRATSQDEVGVIEMGMNHPGEIAPLAAIARPEAGLITNIGVAHIEYMGSRNEIALEKGMLAEALPEGGTLVLPCGDDFSRRIAQRSKAQTLLAGLTHESEVAVQGELLETGFSGSRFRVERGDEVAEVTLPVPGVHMVENALLALAIGSAFGVSLAEGAAGLAESRLTKGRLEHKTIRGIHFLDDSYNANPDSMRAALTTLAALPTERARIAVLGRMGELGSQSETGHRSVGEAAARAGIDTLIAVGDEAHWIAASAALGGLSQVHHVGDPTAAARLLSTLAHPGDLVLIKGSRSVRMERVLEQLELPAPQSAS